MGIPDESPRWLRDYGNVEVNAETLLEFAKSLIEELEQDYKPHAEMVFEDMKAPDTSPPSEFVELVDVLLTHQRMRVETTTRISLHATGVLAFANAADTIARNYGEADAYAEANAAIVERLMADAPSTRDGSMTPGGAPTTTATPDTTTATPPSTGATPFL